MFLRFGALQKDPIKVTLDRIAQLVQAINALSPRFNRMLTNL
jgi:hypothetical protein